MSVCQHCRQGAITSDINGPVCADCWEEGYYETEVSEVVEKCCRTCDHFSGGASTSTCNLPLPWWAEPYSPPRIYSSEGSDCPAYQRD